MIDFLNLGSDEKSTLAGSEFHTLTRMWANVQRDGMAALPNIGGALPAKFG